MLGGRTRKVSEEKKKKMFDLVREGVARSDVASRFGVSIEFVNKLMRTPKSEEEKRTSTE